MRVREHFKIQKYIRRYDRSTGEFLINIAYKTTTEITPRTLAVAEAFGLGIDDKEFTIYDNVELKIGPQDVVLITGESGSGKSVLLRALEKDLGPENAFNIADVAVDTEKPLIDTVGKTFEEGLELLSLVGLNDAFLFLRRYGELSDGQKYRYRIAKLIESQKQFWICLPPYSLITMADGSQKPIKEIKAGERVLSYNLKERKVEAKRALNVYRNPPRPLVRITHEKGVLECTYDHKIFVEGQGYTPALSVRASTQLLYLRTPTLQEYGSQSTDVTSAELSLRRSSGRRMCYETKVQERQFPFYSKPLIKTSGVRSIQILASKGLCQDASENGNEQRMGEGTYTIQHIGASRIFGDIPHVLQEWDKNGYGRVAVENHTSYCFGNLVHGRWKLGEEENVDDKYSPLHLQGTFASSEMAVGKMGCRGGNPRGQTWKGLFPPSEQCEQGQILRYYKTLRPTKYELQDPSKNRTSEMPNMWNEVYTDPMATGIFKSQECFDSMPQSELQGEKSTPVLEASEVPFQKERDYDKDLPYLRRDVLAQEQPTNNLQRILSPTTRTDVEEAMVVAQKKTKVGWNSEKMCLVWKTIHSPKSSCKYLQPRMSKASPEKIQEGAGKRAFQAGMERYTEGMLGLREDLYSSEWEGGYLQSRMPNKEGTNNECKKSTVTENADEATYNLNVEDNHNYFANGVLVSNCDEFAATLDRDTAKIVAFNVQKLARKMGRAVLAATTHTDLFDDLRPSVHIHKGLGKAIQVHYYPNEINRECSLTRDMTITEGSKEDWLGLEPWHYRQGRVPPPLKIYILKRREETAGVIVYSYPSVLCFGRRRAFRRHVPMAELNRDFALISRVVLHPKYRSIGLGVKLVKETLPRINRPYVETVAVMARYNPFFEKADMTKIAESAPDRDLMGVIEDLRRLGFNPVFMVSEKSNLLHLQGLGPEKIGECRKALLGINTGYYKRLKASHKAYIKREEFKEFLEKASLEDLAKVLRRLAIIMQTKVYLLWRAR